MGEPIKNKRQLFTRYPNRMVDGMMTPSQYRRQAQLRLASNRAASRRRATKAGSARRAPAIQGGTESERRWYQAQAKAMARSAAAMARAGVLRQTKRRVQDRLRQTNWVMQDRLSQAKRGVQARRRSGGGVIVEIHARSVTEPTGRTDTRLWGDHTFILIWDTDAKGRKIPGQKPYIFAGYNHAGGTRQKPDGYLYAYGGELNRWYDDFAYLSGKYHNPYHYRGVIWSMTDNKKSAKQVFRRFKQVADRINKVHPKYDFTAMRAPNSNSVVATIIRRGLGFKMNRNSVRDVMRLPGMSNDAIDYRWVP